MAKKQSLQEITKIDLEKSIDENVNLILEKLKNNSISNKELSSFLMENTYEGFKEEIDKKTAIYFKVHKESFSNELSENIKQKNPTIPKKQLEVAIKQGVAHLQGFMDKLQHNPTDKKLAAEFIDLTKTLAETIDLKKLAKVVSQSKEEKPQLVYKKGDIVFYKRMDTDKNYRAGEVLEDSYNLKETTLKSIDYNQNKKDFEISDNLVQIKNEKLSPAFRYKNLTFMNISKDARFKLLQGKSTNFLKAENTYTKIVDGKKVSKLSEEHLKIKIGKNKKGKLDIFIDSNFSLSKTKAYGKNISEEDFNKMKKGEVLLNTNTSNKGQDFLFVMSYNKQLDTIVSKGININYFVNKEGTAQNKAYIGGKAIDKQNIEQLLKGETIKIKNTTIGFASNNDISKWIRKEDIPKEQQKEKNNKKKEKENKEKQNLAKPKNKKAKKGRGLSR